MEQTALLVGIVDGKSDGI